MSIEYNLKRLNEKIEQIKIKNNLKQEITLIAVSKTVSAEKVKEAISCNHFHFGENRVQEGIEKIFVINDNRLTWHLIGNLQSNKASKAVRHFDIIHSIDDTNIASEVNKFALNYNKTVKVLIQINTSGELSKSGCENDKAGEVANFIIENCPHLSLKGLMTIGPLEGNTTKIRNSFKLLTKTRDKLIADFGKNAMEYLSMGMSSDFEIALEEGATHLRIGTAIFGER